MHLVVVHPPGGVAGGDYLWLAVDLGMAAHALLTTPGATKWYKCPVLPATQTLNFRVAAGAVLEWLPQESIIFDGSRAKLVTEIDLEPGGVFIGWEVTCLGRVASGEYFAKGTLSQRTEIRVAGHPVWHERGQIQGSDPLLSSPVGLAGYPVSGTMLFAAPPFDAFVLGQLRSIEANTDSRYGVTSLPRITVARYLGHSTEAAKKYFMRLWQIARPVLLGRPAITPRIWST